MIKKFFRIKVYLWMLIVVFLLVSLAWFVGILTGRTEFIKTIVTNPNETQVVKAMKKQKEVAVLGLSVTDIYSQSQVNSVVGFKVPLSEKTSYIQGTFDAKLGFDGSNVKIKKSTTKANTYNIIVPEFIIIGVSNPKFKEITSSGQILSFATEDVDTLNMQSKALSDESIEKYITPNKEWLEEQTKDYFENLVKSFDSNVKLTFEFKD